MAQAGSVIHTSSWPYMLLVAYSKINTIGLIILNSVILLLYVLLYVFFNVAGMSLEILYCCYLGQGSIVKEILFWFDWLHKQNKSDIYHVALCPKKQARPVITPSPSWRKTRDSPSMTCRGRSRATRVWGRRRAGTFPSEPCWIWGTFCGTRLRSLWRLVSLGHWCPVCHICPVLAFDNCLTSVVWLVACL